MSTSTVTRRDVVRTAFAAASTLALPAIARPAFAADALKVGVFVADTGPAALFGPAQRAAAELGAAQVNAAGGILGRQVQILFVDGGASPAEASKTAIRLLLSDRVEMIFGSHDSAVRQAIEGVVKGKVPYVYTPVYEGSDCASNTFYLGETPQQQLDRSLGKLVELAGGKSFYLVGNDYVWPRTTNAQARNLIEKLGGTVVAEDYYPLGASNNFESTITKIKSAKPAIVLQTVIGGDNVSFNRTFADFGLSDSVLRMSCLLEENTLAGIGKAASHGLHSCLGYFTSLDTPENKAFLQAQQQKYGASAPQQSTIAMGLYNAFTFAKAAADKAKSIDGKAITAAAADIGFTGPNGPMTIRHRNAVKDMYLARCEGDKFVVTDTFEKVDPGQTCT